MFQCTGSNQAGSIQAAARLQIVDQGKFTLLNLSLKLPLSSLYSPSLQINHITIHFY